MFIMKVIGLTGGIGTGKSTTSQIIRSFGVPVIDADVVSRSLLSPGSPYVSQVADLFGNQVLDQSGNIDRKALANIIFASEEMRKKLEALLHPLVRFEMEKRIQDFKDQGEAFIVLDIPLLFEKGYWQNKVDEIWLVDTTQELQIKRIRERESWSEKEILDRIYAQMPLKEKRLLANKIILNNGSIEELENQISDLISETKNDIFLCGD